jgi:hypothetical protein
MLSYAIANPTYQAAHYIKQKISDFKALIIFEWDENKNQLNIRKHGLRFSRCHLCVF